MVSKAKNTWWRKLVTAVLVVFGLTLMAYPYVSNYINGLRQSEVIDGYLSEAASESRLEQDAMLQAAEDYNAALLDSKIIMSEPFDVEAYKAVLSEYYSILDVTDTGMMGYIDIPAISVHLPIYHGTGAYALKNGVGHLETTSFPVGGESTHAVLSAHSGLPQSKLFTDLDELDIGDTFFVTILGREVWYEVYAKETVLPEDVSSLSIQRGLDLCTLVTCTPYGINTHRLLVHGERISAPETEAGSDELVSEATEDKSVCTAKLLIIPAASLLLLLPAAASLYQRKHRKTGNGR